ncbi:MAG: cysteine hydrolase [Spirochaetes bacterium]|nr:cysteine hydrolase [Spirochaetota bacterium]
MKKIFIRATIIIISILILTISLLYFPYKWITIVSDGDAIPQYKNPETALLIIDVQRNLTSKDGTWILNLSQTDEMIDKINLLIKKSAKRDVVVIYITNEFLKYSTLNYFTNRAMEENTDGAKMDERIMIVNNNHFIKSRMDAFTNNEFEIFLKEHRINHIIVTGIDAEDCVDKTVKGALNRKYFVTVITDAIATASDERRDQKIVDFKNLGVETLTTKEFVDRLGVSK